jgi:hypothetical protein
MHTDITPFAQELRRSIAAAGIACLLAPAIAFCQPAPTAPPSPADAVEAVDALVQKVLADRTRPARRSR